MDRKKEIKKYSESIRNEIRKKQENGQSVTSLSNPYDNALAENFFSVLKTEYLSRKTSDL